MAAVTVIQRRCWSRLMLFSDTVSLISATSPSRNVLSSSPLSSPVSWLSPEAEVLLPADVLPLMAEVMPLPGSMVSSSSFSRVSFPSSAASTIISMLSPSSVTVATVVLSLMAAATCI